MKAMKAIKNIYLRILSVCLWTLVLAACKDDTLGIPDKVVEGKPITVSFSFSAAQEKDIVVTRADNSHSTLHSLAIFVYSGDGSIFQKLVRTADKSLILSSRDATSDAEGVLYKVSFETTSGMKKLLAVANTSTTATDGGYWESLSTIATEAQERSLTFDELKSSVINLRSALYTNREMQPIQITSSDQMLMSGWNENVVFDTNGNVTNFGTNVGNKDVILRLDRSMARITFNIPYKAYTQGQLNKIFTPTSYQVYNVPVNAYLANTGEAAGDVFEFVDFAETNVDPVNSGNYSFSFYMPENIYDVVSTDENGNTISEYHDRDKWDSTDNEGASPADKSENDLWAFAPQNSTFVVIKGTYEQSGGTDALDKEYTGNVEYTVHLGDFSRTGSMGNYSVERNCSYTYTVNVLDVDRIVVEAEKEDGNYQEGSEGAIYDYTESDYAYILDAHYEQVYLEYNLSQIATAAQKAVNLAQENGETLTIDQAIADALVLTIQSEAMDYEHEETTDEPYSVHNKQGTLKPYQIYVNAGADAAAMKEKVLNGTDGDMSGFDYKWVEFWPQTGISIASYPGVSDWSQDDVVNDLKNPNVYGGDASGNTGRLMDVYDVIVEMGKAVKEICNGEEPSAPSTGWDNYQADTYNGNIIVRTNTEGDYVARFTAFVNEYYYYHHPLTGEKITSWSLFTNKMPREMIVAMSTSVSTDGNSSYSVLYSYISQLSIQTFYNSRADNTIHGFGMETYNETPLCMFGKSFGEGDDSDGRQNQLDLLGNERRWNMYIENYNNGWKSPVTSNRTTHQLKDVYKDENCAYYACLSRNRDLDGNGTIENGEVRWYLASLNEYIRMGIGSDAISNAAQLYTGDKLDEGFVKKYEDPTVYPLSYIDDGALYYTSSADAQRVYWAIERGSYGGTGNKWAGESLGDEGCYLPKPIRCIRLLPGNSETIDISTVDGINSASTYEWNETNRTLTFSDKLVDALYRERVDGILAPHNEDQPANRFYQKIVVAEDMLKDTYPLGQIIQLNDEDGYPDYINRGNPCANYSENGDGDATWRVPNLVELSAMHAVDKNRPIHSEDLAPANTACCTQFTNQNVRLGFIVAAEGTYITCPGNNETLANEYRVRCVRDVTE